MHFFGDQIAPPGQFKQWHSFLGRAARDSKELLAVGFGKTTVAFGDVRCDGKSRPVELVDEEPVAAGELLGVLADRVGEIDGLLLDLQLLEREGHRYLYCFEESQAEEESRK